MQFKLKKAVQAINYIAENNNGVVKKLKAIKLIWFADRFHLRNFGRTITGDKYVAMPYGPVPSISLDVLNHNTYTAKVHDINLDYVDEYLRLNKVDIESLQSTNLRVFSSTDIEALDAVLSRYNDVDRFDLAEISHEFPEWNKFESQLKDPTAPKAYPMDISDFFVDVAKYELFAGDKEITAIAKDIFLESKEVNSIF